MARPLQLTLALACAAGCVSARRTPVPDPLPLPRTITVNEGNAARLADVTVAIEKRLTELKARGGTCSDIAAVLEASYRSGQITIRPFMWRVGTQLASGEAKPNGDMILAREIDSLNVGVRTLADLLWSMQHEAAHLAFKIAPPPGHDASEDRANDYVRACEP